MSETTDPTTPEPAESAARPAPSSGWKTFLQVALIVAAVLLVQRVLLPKLGVGT